MLVKGNKYIRQPIRNAADLERERERIRMKYKKIEARMLFTFFGSAAQSLVGSLRKSRRKKKKNPSRAKNGRKSIFGKIRSILKKPPVAAILKAWLRWQLFRLFYIGLKNLSRQKRRVDPAA